MELVGVGLRKILQPGEQFFPGSFSSRKEGRGYVLQLELLDR
jgi:hypothetical protein